jgi:hypothetical protein
MTCQEFVELVTDYLENRLDPAVRADFEAHIEPCPWCGYYLEQIRLVSELAPETREPQLTTLAERLLPAFRDFAATHGPG